VVEAGIGFGFLAVMIARSSCQSMPGMSRRSNNAPDWEPRSETLLYGKCSTLCSVRLAR
jgi:hypothetical protein